MIRTVEDLIKALEKLDKKRNIVKYSADEYGAEAYFNNEILTLKQLEIELEEEVTRPEGVTENDYVL